MFELDWFKPDVARAGAVDVVLAADVVWIEELIEPMVATLAALAKANVGDGDGDSECAPPVVLFAYQSRSRRGDDKLFGLLAAHGFAVAEIPLAEHHPEFQDPIIKLYRITYTGQQQQQSEGGEGGDGGDR